MNRLARLLVLCCVTVVVCAPALAADARAGKKDAAKKKPVNTACPVTGDKADAAQTATYEGKLVAFCCEDCVGEFNKDPKKFATQVEVAERRAKQQQKGDGKKKVEQAKKDDAPKKGDRPAAKKPVNALCVVHPEDAVDPTVTTEYEGRIIGFCCEDCLKRFDLDPEKYAARLKK